jgi:molecular chaperone DnaJ
MDLYALLGVGRGASAGEIERAYRRLARRYHPGINPGDRMAEEVFRQIQRAFDILGDAERRREYDRGTATPAPPTATVSVALEGFDFSAPAHGAEAATFSELFADVFQEAAREALSPSRGSDLETALRLSFRDAVAGGAFPMSVARQERCGICLGDGRVACAPVVCPACNGDGARRWARGHMVFARTCDVCEGAGRLSSQVCRSCRGVGLQPRSEVVTVIVPPGVNAGDRVAVPGRGHAGARGGPSGDLYVTLEVEGHPFFARSGRDLHLTLPLAVHEAALGARVEVPTLAGSPVRLKVPPGTPSGRRFRLRGLGVPPPAGAPPEAAGDLVVDVQIVLPPIRDERSKQLIREFGELNGRHVRDHLFEGGAPRGAEPG